MIQHGLKSTKRVKTVQYFHNYPTTFEALLVYYVARKATTFLIKTKAGFDSAVLRWGSSNFPINYSKSENLLFESSNICCELENSL